MNRAHVFLCLQSTSPIAVAKETFQTKGVRGFYSGCGALVAGNAVKAAVRFYSYDKFKAMLVNKDGKLTGPRSLAGGDSPFPRATRGRAYDASSADACLPMHVLLG